jgi:hypothetical protein
MFALTRVPETLSADFFCSAVPKMEQASSRLVSETWPGEWHREPGVRMVRRSQVQCSFEVYGIPLSGIVGPSFTATAAAARARLIIGPGLQSVVTAISRCSYQRGRSPSLQRNTVSPASAICL